MTSEGHLYDKKSNAWYYYYSFTNPDWFVIYRVWRDAHRYHPPRNDDRWLGFALAAIIIISSAYTSRLAYRADAHYQCHQNRRPRPRLEAMLSHTIQSNKSVDGARTHDALTGCKNRRAFDSDQPSMPAALR
jgi:hypothetical protein